METAILFLKQNRKHDKGERINMKIGSEISTSVLPNIASLLGTAGEQHLLNAVSNYQEGESVFGSFSDPLKAKWDNFKQDILYPVRDATVKIKDTWNRMFGEIEFVTVTTPEQIVEMPCEMYPHIMTDPTIQYMHKNEQIHGFGYDPAIIQDLDDTAGRLIGNGKITSDILETDNKDDPVEFVWEWCSEDPDWGPEDIEAIETTRQFIKDTFLAEFMGTEESVDRDPTAPNFYRTEYVGNDELN